MGGGGELSNPNLNITLILAFNFWGDLLGTGQDLLGFSQDLVGWDLVRQDTVGNSVGIWSGFSKDLSGFSLVLVEICQGSVGQDLVRIHQELPAILIEPHQTLPSVTLTLIPTLNFLVPSAPSPPRSGEGECFLGGGDKRQGKSAVCNFWLPRTDRVSTARQLC